jgi:hypothetical protein
MLFHSISGMSFLSFTRALLLIFTEPAPLFTCVVAWSAPRGLLLLIAH